MKGDGAMAKIGRNEPCPCGSGLKYKKCCYAPAAGLERDEDGKIHEVIPLGPEAIAIIKRQEEKFRERFGREMGPHDKIFFDAPAEDEYDRLVLEAMQKVGTHPAIIHAYQKTGRMVSRENAKYIPRKDLRAWHEAVDEWYAQHPED